MASGWESVGQGFKPQRLETTFDPGLPIKKIQQKYSQPNSVVLMVYFAGHTLKDKKILSLEVQKSEPLLTYRNSANCKLVQK